MLKGAFIFALGASSGLVVGVIGGLFAGFMAADSMNKVAIGPFPPGMEPVKMHEAPEEMQK